MNSLLYLLVLDLSYRGLSRDESRKAELPECFYMLENREKGLGISTLGLQAVISEHEVCYLGRL